MTKRARGKDNQVDKVDTRKPEKKGKARRDWKPVFLDAFRHSANVRAACEKAGVSRNAAYAARDKSKSFAADWDAAEQDAVDTLEARAWKRSERSDTILMFLLRVRRFGDKQQHEITGKDGGPLHVKTDLSAMDDGDLESEIDALLTKRRAVAPGAGAVGGTAARAGSTAEGETA